MKIIANKSGILYNILNVGIFSLKRLETDIKETNKRLNQCYMKYSQADRRNVNLRFMSPPIPRYYYRITTVLTLNSWVS